MNAVELRQFYEAALTAGAISAGFIGTFLAFRIQREANYYRQPVLDFKEKKAEDVLIDKAHFTSSFLLIILAAICSTLFGIFWPLLALANWPPAQTGPAPIVGGLASSFVLVAAYFVDELVHYRILKTDLVNDVQEWKLESVIVVAGILLAALLFCVLYHVVAA